MARRPLTSQHDWYLAGQLAATINPPQATFPRLEINQEKGIAGFYSAPDADEPEADTPAGRRGEVPFPRTSRGKTLTYNLRLIEDEDGTYGDLTADLSDYLAVFQDRSSIGLLVVQPWEAFDDVPPDEWEIWATFARVLAFDADELVAYGPGRQPSPWIRDPILSLRQLDGLWIWANESGAFLTPMIFDVPSGSGVDVTNSGNAPTPPTVTVYDVNSGEDLHIGRNLDPSGTLDLWFRDPVGLAGGTTEDVVVDFPNRKVFVNGTDVTESYDAAASSWWDEFVEGIPPGTHTVFIGAGAGVGLKVHFYSASW